MYPANEDLHTIENAMDLFDQPMFLIDVEGPKKFVFRWLNSSHQSTTGICQTAICGQMPHDVFPARLADTVVNNYETCRASGESYTYEETLDLPHGARWWQTTLSPIKNSMGEVVQVLGVAFDITDHKESSFDASQKLSEMAHLNEDLQVFAATTAQDMRGPFQTMIALLELVIDGFVDLGDEKSDQLMLCSDIAHDAIRSMSAILHTAEGLKLHENQIERVDLHHIASDIVALTDPHQRLNIDLPRVRLRTDRVALQMVLRNLLSNAVRYADRNVAVTVRNQQGGAILISVSDDGVGQTSDLRSDGKAILPKSSDSGSDFGLASAQAVVQARGGKVMREKSFYPTGATVSFSLPGEIASDQSTPADAREGVLSYSQAVLPGKSALPPSIRADHTQKPPEIGRQSLL